MLENRRTPKNTFDPKSLMPSKKSKLYKIPNPTHTNSRPNGLMVINNTSDHNGYPTSMVIELCLSQQPSNDYIQLSHRRLYKSVRRSRLKIHFILKPFTPLLLYLTCMHVPLNSQPKSAFTFCFTVKFLNFF